MSESDDVYGDWENVAFMPVTPGWWLWRTERVDADDNSAGHRPVRPGDRIEISDDPLLGWMTLRWNAVGRSLGAGRARERDDVVCPVINGGSHLEVVTPEDAVGWPWKVWPWPVADRPQWKVDADRAARGLPSF